ncbi:MAG: SRPBCC domain-containing protein [Rubricoccaceae bacterium]|nr:SRPBCC domain-containing protein [Rubricoccaceae bacterium]
MDRTFTVQTTINRSSEDVFNAIVDPDMLTKYFVDRTSGKLEPGARIVWFWERWGDYPVEVDEVIPNKRISLRLNSVAWKKSETDNYDVRVDIEIEPLEDGRTMLKISETGWKGNAEGIKASYENCGGWQHMADCAKCWLEHGIDLRGTYTPAEVK